MNVIQNIKRIARAGLAYALVMAILAANPCLGADPVMHVTWAESPPPVEGTHYVVFTDPPASVDFPDVELIEESLTWRIWSTDPDNPGGLGEIGVISSPYPKNFGVKIEDDLGGPGALNVLGINLDPTSGSNYSNITGGTIAWYLANDLFVQASSTGEGGEVTLEIQLDAIGNITAHTINDLVIGGNALGTIDIQSIPDLSSVSIGGSLSGDISVAELSGTLEVARDVEETATIEVAMNGPSLVWLNSDTTMFGYDYECRGEVRLSAGIPMDAHVLIGGVLTDGASIDLQGTDVAGGLLLERGGGGTILNGGAVTGLLWDSLEGVHLAAGEYTFSGVATFASVPGVIKFDHGADLTGTIAVTGDMTGYILVWDEWGPGCGLEPGGEITVGNTVSGFILVDDGIAGEIRIGTDLVGQIWTVGSLEDTGRILIDGACAGNIVMEEETAELSLIHVVEGLRQPGAIWINENRGDYHANGTIRIGDPGPVCPDPLPPWPFSGSIHVLSEDGGPGGGDLNGVIDIGCLSSLVDGDIFVEGDFAGQIYIDKDVSVTIDVDGDLGGSLLIDGAIVEGGAITVGANLLGQLAVGSDMDGVIHVDGDIALGSSIDIAGDVYCGEIVADADGLGGGTISGYVDVVGVFNGEICDDTLDAGGPLPANINLQSPGIAGTICGTVVGVGLDCSEDPCFYGHVQRYADIECETSNDCVSDACDYTCTPHLFGDVSPISSVVPPCVSSDYLLIGDNFTNMLDVFCVFNAFNEGSPYTICPCCDVAPTCGEGDGFCNMLDVYAIFETFNGSAPCDDWCACTPCGGGAAARSGGGGERPVESGELLVRFLGETAPIIEENYIEIVEYMVGWLVGHMSDAQRGALADRLEDPSREFASRLAARMTPAIVSALRGE